MRLLGLIFLLSFTSQCATYWKNRKNDLLDVVTLGAETPMYGAAVKIGPLPVGLLFQGGESSLGKRDLGRGIGLRGGKVSTYHSQQLVYTFLGGESFHSGEPLLDAKGNWLVDKKGIPLTTGEREIRKSYKMRYFSYFNDPIQNRKKRKKETFRRELTKDLVRSTGRSEFLAYLPPEDTKPFGYPPEFLWQVELTFGVYGGGRVGFNFAEMLDLMVGFTGIDILDDDVEGSTKNPLPIPGFPFPPPSAEEEADSAEQN